MKTKDWILGAVEIVAWYGLAYTLLYSMKHEVNLYLSALLMVAFLYLAGFSCPFVRHLQAWKDMWREQ
jgi:hypothetical protein